MDPVTTTIIVTALTMGATKIAEGALGKVGEEAYNGLKGLLSGKLQDKNVEDAVIIEEFEKAPLAQMNTLNTLLIDNKLNDDAQLSDAANNFLSLFPKTEITKYCITFNAPVQGAVQGDGHIITFNFNQKDENK
jgi:hypothetical protein